MHDVKRPKYRIFDVVVQSEIELPELDSEACGAPDHILTMAPASKLEAQYDWLQIWYRDDDRTRVDSCVAKANGGYRMRFCGQADFLILGDGHQIVCEPHGDTPVETIRHLFLDQIVPRILGQRGEVVLHASAVELAPGIGIAFIGKSGWGKSTLATSFREVGARLLCDDCLQLKVIDGALAGIPAYGGSRLWQDSLEALFPAGVRSGPVSHNNAKRRVDIGERSAAATTLLKALFFLDSPETAGTGRPEIRTMNGSAAVVEMIKRSFLLDSKSVDTAAEQFAAIGRLVATRPVFYSLQYPRDYARLPEVRQAIVRTVSRLHALGSLQQASA